MALAPRSTALRGLSLALGGVLALAGVVAIQTSIVPAAHAATTAVGIMAPSLDVTTLYVAESGDDVPTNPCTAIDAPCLTVGGAVDRGQAAIDEGAVDVIVHIAAGTYAENVAIGSVDSGHSMSLVGEASSTTTIDGLGTTSVVKVTSGTVNLTGLSITGGYSDSGGGIYNHTGTLTITDSRVSGNTAAGVSTAGGGGIYNNAGTVTISGSTVSDNTSATGYAGGIFNSDSGTLSVTDSMLSGNAGWYVGGIHNRGTLSVSNSTLSGNTATNVYGGGISNFGGTMTITDSTLSGNSAPSSPNSGKGGAIYNRGVASVINSTLYGNTATFGGGIHNLGSGQLTLRNSTLADNTATRNGGGIRWEGGSITVANSVISTSSCDVNSVIVDGGYNVSDSCRFQVPSGTSITGSTTIGLAPLAANGSAGPWTMAIDSNSSAHHLVPTCTGTDARGLPRPGFGATADCDAGAYELQAAAPEVTADPASQTLAIGSDATFTATASGAPTPTVQWQVHSGSAWSDVSGATTTTLSVEDVTHAMSGAQYRAVFTNGVAPDATTAAATLTVPVGALDRLVVAPSSATVVAGGTQAFTAEGFDAFGNSLGDVTSATTFTGSTGLACAYGVCTSHVTGDYTVTGTNGVATGTASLTVAAGALDSLVVSPATGTVSVGVPQAYTAEGFDTHGNSLGDVTGATVFAGSTGLTCADGSCTSSVAGVYTVTGTNGVVTDAASQTVEAIPVVPLPADKPTASGPLAGVPTISSPGGQFTVTASGFAPYSPVTFGIYSVVQTLGQTVADSSGTAVMTLQVPASFAGAHTIVAAGMGPSLTPIYLEAPVFVAQLAITGTDVDLIALSAAGTILVLLGSLGGIAAYRRRRALTTLAW